ncbi:hypothetical protein SMAC4_14172 [Sordaria macrospora]|uniref:uncharacterized protein n=1 Tax=Sordaria macrospora TaxID=5147 RepID=UPI002B2BD8D9|nr:hypothetical protein SMAC4_14172 [Sordaria macrospora]
MAINDFECEQYDFNTAFLNALIPEDGKKYYVEQPTGLEKEDRHTWVCQLVRALYGLKRSPLFWFETLLPVLKALGFTPIGADLCLLVNNTLGAIMVLYVDDFLLAAANLKIITHIKGTLEKKFKLKHLGPVGTFLGFDIVRNRTERTVFISQERYTKTMIDKFTKGLAKGQDLHPTKTPWPPDFKIHGGGEVSGQQKAYIKSTGSLNYLSTGTRPDITFTVSKLCEGNAKPTDRHLTVMKHLYRYLTGHSDLGIVLGGRFSPTAGRLDLQFRAYADASFADNIPDRKSTAGHVVFLTCGPIHWKSKKQSLVTTSTTEAEFVNLVPTAKSLEWIGSMLKDLGLGVNTNQILYTDSENARNRVLNVNVPARNRYIDIRYKWLIQQAEMKTINVIHLAGEDMPADGLTKALKADKHAKFVKLIGLVQQKVPWT